MGFDFVFDTIGEAIDLQDSLEDKQVLIDDITEWLGRVRDDLPKA